MRAYSDDEMQAYITTGDPMDKAGAYAIQHPGFFPVARWEGCYPSIMGLPLGLAAVLLTETGIAIRTDVASVCERISGASCCARDNRAPTACGP
jgi:predicted house-cleaning NTP pyrophosphatase (Maf/HAM1 superfamily)